MTGTIRTLPPILLAGALALAGCAGSDAIVTESPSSTAAAATAAAGAAPSPSATALTDDELLAMMPADAARDDVAGAMATAEYFVSAYPEALMAADARVLRAMSLPTCSFCADVVADVDHLAETGERLSAGTLSPDLSQLQAVMDDDGHAHVQIPVSQSRFEYVDSAGRSAGSSDPGVFVMSFLLTRTDTVWRINGVYVEDA
ncbi:DUF6318 family protein [Demequina capsici]|uniref:DUF6318 family protein n=1 Tax=Demequina capsici TaxID=3075620 RepID=A0AA96FBE7_9MICO|nr:DUF6318 family protein [Demequina sp. PMTSA13]WNM26618.1 DUF6318 family protein [Demequina sp. PMTSA13]